VEGPSGDREQWDKPIEFLLSCIAMSVGLGNIWRFPFTAYENGGGAFIIPYLIVLFCIGKPMYFLEMAVGQFSSRGQVKIWKMAPIFKGIKKCDQLYLNWNS
jgi:solute carrier family 6 amino acid transporter-like protein 5/7/9/14